MAGEPGCCSQRGPSEARPALPVGSDRAGSGAPASRCGGVRDATNKEGHVCARRRDGEPAGGEPQPGRRALQQRGEPDDPLHLEEQWYPAEALALTESKRPTQFPEEPFGLVIDDLVIEKCGLEKWEDSFESLGRDKDQNQGKSQGSLGKIDRRRHPRSPLEVRP